MQTFQSAFEKKQENKKLTLMQGRLTQALRLLYMVAALKWPSLFNPITDFCDVTRMLIAMSLHNPQWRKLNPYYNVSTIS